MKKERSLDLVKAGIWGVCVGDALGLPVQFKNRDFMRRHPVDTMTGYGTFNMPPGSISDDGSLTLCLAESLSRGFNLTSISQNFLLWYDSGHLTPKGEAYDIGRSTELSMQRLKHGISPYHSGGSELKDNGNGSLMRILPLLFYLDGKKILKSDWFKYVKEVSAITHGHILSVICCLIYLHYINFILEGASLHDAYYQLRKNKKHYYSILGSQHSHAFENIFEKDLTSFTDNDIQSTGYSLHSLEASLWCLLTSNSYATTVLKAVNLGDDTDTIAAIAGGAAGIFYDIHHIPADWMNTITLLSDINKISEDLYKFCYC